MRRNLRNKRTLCQTLLACQHITQDTGNNTTIVQFPLAQFSVRHSSLSASPKQSYCTSAKW